MDIQAYFEEWSCKPGDVARLAISTPHKEVRATLVRLVSGPGQAGDREGRVVDLSSVLDRTVPGRLQSTMIGSYAKLPLPTAIGGLFDPVTGTLHLAQAPRKARLDRDERAEKGVWAKSARLSGAVRPPSRQNVQATAPTCTSTARSNGRASSWASVALARCSRRNAQAPRHPAGPSLPNRTCRSASPRTWRPISVRRRRTDAA
jgi:hypothetical protein